MKNYLVLYYSPPEAMQKMATSSKEEMEAGQKAWMDWFDSIGNALVEKGDFFVGGAQLQSGNVTDSPGPATGYSLVQAKNLDEAKSLLKNHPHLEWFEGCKVEVYEPRGM